MNIKLFLVIFSATLAITIIGAIIGNILESNGTLGNLSPRAITTIKVVFLFLFCLLAFSLIPLLLHFFIASQGKIGNAELSVINWLRGHEKGVVYGVWLVFLIGLCMAIPAAIRGGFFNEK